MQEAQCFRGSFSSGFLAKKYGADVIEVTVEPAEEFDPSYPEEDEDIPK
jgi:hypothetical protein